MKLKVKNAAGEVRTIDTDACRAAIIDERPDHLVAGLAYWAYR